MTLSEYLGWKGLTRKEFAEIADVTESFLSLLVAGKRRPSPDTAAKIEAATDGNVDRMDLLYPTGDRK